jgi:hypothetical protein
MLAATQLGLVPPEVKQHQDELVTLARKVREAWPAGSEYKSEDVRRIATSINRSINELSDAIGNALEDSIVKENTALGELLFDHLGSMRKFQRSLSTVVDQSRAGVTVSIAELRAAIPEMMTRVAGFWRDANQIHDKFLGWIGGDQADAIAQGFRDVLVVVQSLPGAKAPLGFLSRHRGKIALGVALVGVSGAATLWFLRRRQSSDLYDVDLLPAGEPQIPVGIHVFRAGSGEGHLPEERPASPLANVARMLAPVAEADADFIDV